MAKQPKPKERRTWDGLFEGDVTGADEAEESMPIEFGRKRKPEAPPRGTKPPENPAGK